MRAVFLHGKIKQTGATIGDTVREDTQDIAAGEEADELDHLKVTQ